jgi:S-DNA-T family DNA segregation ATPase FtsK/SpoIIIE
MTRFPCRAVLPALRIAWQLLNGLLRPAGLEVSFSRDPTSISALLGRLTGEIDRRQGHSARGLPSLVVLLIEPDRLTPLRRVGDGFGRAANPLYDQLRRVLADGSQQGIHLIVVAAALRLLAQVIDERRDPAYFNHRVALQMNEDDSFALFRSRKACQLHVEGSPLPCALYANEETNQSFRFKPYEATLEPQRLSWVVRQLTRP